MSAELKTMLAKIGAEGIAKISTYLADIDAHPWMWSLPGLSKLQPYEAELKTELAFLATLDQQLSA